MEDMTKEGMIACLVGALCIGIVVGSILMFNLGVYGHDNLLKFKIIKYNEQGQVVWKEGTEVGRVVGSKQRK